MITNQALQNTIDGLKNITRKDISVLDRDGKVIASTESDSYPEIRQIIEAFLNSLAENQLVQGYQYFKVFDSNLVEYIIILPGEDEDTYRVGKIVTFHVQTLMMAYKERFDRDSFIKNLLLDNLLRVDIYSRAKMLRIDSDLKRVVFLIETTIDPDMSALEVVNGIFPDKTRDFVTAIDENSIILVKEISDRDSAREIEQVAKTLVDTLSSEAMSRVSVAIGAVVKDLKYVSNSFKEARLAHEVGKIFESEKQIINYERLGIGRLIYQLPLPLCRIFINEMLQGFSIEDVDDELSVTVAKFFENDLNVSETARALYIHRNTLVYRLDKLQKMTKLDLRKFGDAITFKIALMVSKYLQFREKQVFY